MTDLFRKQAVEHGTHRLEGELVLATPLSTQLLGAVAAIIIVTVVVFASTATYARKELVSGWITPEQGVVRATTLYSGRVEAVFVSEGDVLAAGAPIARLRHDTLTSSGSTGVQILSSLQDQADAAERVAVLEIERLASERDRLAGSLSGFRSELEGLENEISLQRERIALVQTQVARAEQLAEQGLVSRRELGDRQDLALQARQALAALERQRTRLARQISEIEYQLETIPLLVEGEQARAASVLMV